MFDFNPQIDTPKNLYNAFRNLEVRLYDGHVHTVDVHHYKNSGLKRFSTEKGRDDWGKLSRKLEELWEKQGRKRRGTQRSLCFDTNFGCFEECYDPGAFSACYWAQQRPATYAKLLRLAVAVGHIAPTRMAIQAYCDAFLGVDCKGFTQSFFGGHLIGKDLSEMHRYGAEIKTLRDIVGHEAIIWNNHGHIALVDSVVDRKLGANGQLESVTVEVVESTASQRNIGPGANGVQDSRYVLLADPRRPGAFTVKRPYANAKDMSMGNENVKFFRFRREVELAHMPPFRVEVAFPPLRLGGPGLSYPPSRLAAH